jgi:hypothetical protein
LPALAVDVDSSLKFPDVHDAKAVQSFLDQLPKELRDPNNSLSAVRELFGKMATSAAKII